MENLKQLNLLKARNFGEKISDAFALIRINLGVMLKAQFLISLPIIIVTATVFVLVFRDYFSLLSSIESGPFEDVLVRRDNFVRFLVFSMFAYLAASPVTIVTLVISDRYARSPNEKVTFDQVWQTTRQKFLKLMALRLILGPLTIMAYFVPFMPMGPSLTGLNITLSILLLFPGIIFMVLFLAADLLILQHNYPIGRAISRSASIMSRNFWPAFSATGAALLLFLAANLLMIIPGKLLGMVEDLTTGYKDPQSFWTIFMTALRGFNTIAGFVLFAIPVSTIAVQYFTIRETVARAGIMDRIRHIGIQEVKQNVYAEDEQY